MAMASRPWHKTTRQYTLATNLLNLCCHLDPRRLCFLLGGIHWIFEEKEIIISNSESNNFHEIKEAYVKFLANDVHGLKKIYHKNLEAFFSRVTVCRDTIFHVAAYRGSEEMLEILVKLLPPARKRELLRMKNVYGNTVLYEAAATGKI
ncbi:hypothetical protein F3Y22_tig00117028pilonHSYRG00047 [Hibiscus syriacus]|uniref:Uncharacterized protein n=1 Tax=Hibiscus syriacus TaxID=106335 RepID=A0A6A2WDV4_HIBSY|nr:hypothetical protein F3Y22_tig00117028pilonHSYRG00047 [Hibiscus syriacus]